MEQLEKNILVSEVSHYVFNNKLLMQLTNLGGIWERSTVVLIGDFNSTPFNLTIGVFNVGDKIVANINGVNNNILKFYTDNTNLFLQFNCGANQMGNFLSYSLNSNNGYFKAKISGKAITDLVEVTF